MLSDGWGIGADEAQWLVMKYRAPDWRPVSFVASSKAVLLRCLREKGADITPEGQAALDTLPDHFKTWRRARGDVAAIAIAA